MDGSSATPDAGQTSIQDRLYPDASCFGCGPANVSGLRLRSFVSGDAVVASFLPWPEHDNGLGFLNGGIICTLLDCHSAAAAMNVAHERGWRPVPGAALPYVTAGIDVRFLRPSPLHEPVQLRSTVIDADESRIMCAVELCYDGKQRATAQAEWRRWRPR
jgi:acyl-coenzyme A thioesterase PaaI-like protein